MFLLLGFPSRAQSQDGWHGRRARCQELERRTYGGSRHEPEISRLARDFHACFLRPSTSKTAAFPSLSTASGLQSQVLESGPTFRLLAVDSKCEVS
jgi:hypothetical protein